MPYGAHETMEVHETLNELINRILHFELYAEQARDPELWQMIDGHVRTARNIYRHLAAYTHDYAAAGRDPLEFEHTGSSPGQVVYGLDNPGSRGPYLQDGFNDGQIAQAVLLSHKNAAKLNLAAALECADPNIRRMLAEAAVSCTDQAYETFLYMNRRGIYQVPTMQDRAAKAFLHGYQTEPGQPRM